MTSILDRHRERFHATPGDNQAFEALEEHYFLAGEWNEVIALYEHRMTAPALAVNRRELAQLRFRMGQVYQERLADEERAISCFTAVLQDDPGNRPALAQLRRAHSARGSWDVALQIAELESELPMRPSERAALLAEMGGIWLDALDDAEQSLDYFERALEDQGDHRRALEGAARACEALGRHAEAAERWESLVALLKGRERAAAQVALARLTAGPLAQTERARDLYRSALGDDPNNREAIAEVAAQAEAREQWPALADLLERRFELEREASDRALTAARLGGLYRERLGNPAAARMWLERAAAAGCDQPGLFEALADYARECGDDEALLRYLERTRSLAGDAAPVSLLLELAALHSDRGDDERALAELECAVERAPEDALAIEALSDSLARLGRNEELALVLERRASLAALDPEARAAAHAELAALFEDRMSDPDAALRSYEQAFEADPDAPGVAAALERLYRKSEDWEPLRALLRRSSVRGNDAERIRALCALGALESEQFGDLEAAARALDAALEIDPMNAVAHRGLQHIARATDDDGLLLAAYRREASVCVEPQRGAFLLGEVLRILEARGETAAALDWVRERIEDRPDDLDALRACANLEQQCGDADGLIASLEALEALLPDEEQSGNLRRLAEAYRSVGRADEALAAWQRAASVDPSDVVALGEIATHFEAEGRLTELAEVQRRLADLLPEEARVRCLDALATLLSERLCDLPAATRVLERLMREEQAPPDTIDRYESLLERGARFEELAHHLAERSAAGGDVSAALDLRRARLLLDHLDRAPDAALAYREAHRKQPDSTEALDGLERALRAAGDLHGLAAFLAERIESSDEPHARDALSLARAKLLDDSLGERDAATDAYRRLASEAEVPGVRREASERLDTLLTRAKDWTGLRQHLEASLENASDAEAADLHERLAALCADRLEDPQAACEHLERCAALDDARPAVWRALARHYEAAERFEDVVDAIAAELATGPDRDRELALQVRAARTCALRLEDRERALPHFERALELDPTHPEASEYLIAHCERAGDLERVVALLETRLSQLDSAPRDPEGSWAAQRCALRLRIAEIRSGELDDLDGAIVVLEPGLGELGPCSAIAEPLAELYRRAGFSEELIALCRDSANACEVESERANWYVRLGDSLRADGRDRDAAVAYRQALTDRPDDRDVQASLREIYRRLHEPEPLVRLLEVELSHLAGEDEIPTRLELASLLKDGDARAADALLHLRRVLEIEPAHREALALALELAPRLSSRETLLELLGHALRRAATDAERAALLAQRARLLADGLDRPEAAIASYREAISLDPGRRADRDALRALLTARCDWPALLDALFEEACRSRGDAASERLAEAADVAWERLDHDAALPWLMRLREARPGDAGNLARISEVHRRAGRSEALLRALDDEIAIADAPFALHRECARILEDGLGSPERAVDALEAAHAAAPDDRDTLEQLERLYRITARHRERARVLEDLLAGPVGDRRITLLCDAAALYNGPLEDPERAARHLLSAVDAARGTALHPELLRALGGALRRSGRPDAWARCAEAELRALDPDSPVLSDRRRELRRELATTYETELGRPDAALRHLRALVDLKWTEWHGAGTGELDAIEAALQRLLRAEQGWIELASRLGAHVERRPEDFEAWRELAQVREERLRTPVAANAAYRAALALRPDDVDSIRGLRRCSELVGDWEAVAEALQLELDHAPELGAHERAARLRRLGDISWLRLGSTTRASRAFASALECCPEDFESLRSHQRLLEAMEDWTGALDLYESEIEMLGNAQPERRRSVSLRVGEIAGTHTDEIERALRGYAYADAIEELSLDRRAELARLHRRNGDIEAFIEVFGAWCDDPASPAGAEHQRELSLILEQQGRVPEALARIDRAAALAPESAAVWDAAARLRLAGGDPSGSADALEHAAALVAGDDACDRLRLAAALTEADDAEKALERYRAAARHDPANAATAAALARVSSEVGDFAESIEMAERALVLADSGPGLDAALLCSTALVGARAARERGKAETAARFYSRALAIEPGHADALAEYGETLAGLGDLPGAQAALEARLEMRESDDARALHLAMIGAALCASEAFDAACGRLEEAIATDPKLDRAHDDLIEVYRQLDRVDDGIAALERWVDLTDDAGERAARLLRAAQWELASDDRHESAERHLRDALEADPGITRAWVLLAELLWSQGRGEEALDVASLALDGARDTEDRGKLALIKGRAFEQRGDRREAAEAFGIAARENPRDIEAALSSARLLRGLGEWRPAADTLDAFAARHPGDDARGLADVLQQLGRLLAGPLEDVDGAIASYRRALALDPERVDTRASLAEFLSHRPDDRDEALGHHAALLAEDPTHAQSLRVLLRIAREEQNAVAITTGLGVLRALGIASPHEVDETPPKPTFRCAGERRLEDPLDEKLRRLAVEASRELAQALEASPSPTTVDESDAAAAFRAHAIAAEGELSAAALVPLTEQTLGEALTLAAAIALDPEQVQGDGRLVNAMSTAIRRRLRRRLRKLLEGETLERIASVDFGAWRTELRALASAVALDENDGDLRIALAVLISEESEHPVLDLPGDADLTPYVAAYPRARSLMRRVVRTWLESLGRGA